MRDPPRLHLISILYMISLPHSSFDNIEMLIKTVKGQVRNSSEIITLKVSSSYLNKLVCPICGEKLRFVAYKIKRKLIVEGIVVMIKVLQFALGKLACSRAISTEYITASDIMELSAAKNIADRHKFRDRLKKIKLLIIDDLFITDFSDTTYAKYLHDVIDDRMGSTSTIFETQLTDAGIASGVKNIDVPVADALVRRIKNCAFDIVLQPQQLIAQDGAKYA